MNSPAGSEDLAFWYRLHTDVAHTGTRDDCEHCQEMIRAFGPMPSREALQSYRPPRTPKAYEKKRIPRELRLAVFTRDAYTCQQCQLQGTTENLRADHIIPERDGGPATMENLQTLCVSCNSAKGARR